MTQQTENWKLSNYWNGYCPECWLKGKQVRMKLNEDDFFECEESMLQIALTFPNILATILKFRGKGKLKANSKYADETPRNEVLCPQIFDNRPFNDEALFKTSKEVEHYLDTEIELID